jgi:hypothetical protein
LVVLQTTPEQDATVMDFIEFIANNPGVQAYNLLYANCSDFFAYYAPAHAGIYLPSTPIPRLLLWYLKRLPNAVKALHNRSHGRGEPTSPNSPSFGSPGLLTTSVFRLVLQTEYRRSFRVSWTRTLML